MAADKPVFGWGLESYGSIFLRYTSSRRSPDGFITVFVDAHSDWLQALAELGFAGTALLLLVGLLPLADTFRLRNVSAVSAWLLAGCGMIAAYAWVEFPFACPAVVATWWVLWFSALRTLQLTPASTSSASGSPPSAPNS
jgi:O-antigen ligase